MQAQAIIIEQAAFQQASGKLNPADFLNGAGFNGCPCALITDMPHAQAEQHLDALFGGVAHHIFSVVLTGADFKAGGGGAPFETVLRLLDVPRENAVVVAHTARARKAAQSARLQLANAAVTAVSTAAVSTTAAPAALATAAPLSRGGVLQAA